MANIDGSGIRDPQTLARIFAEIAVAAGREILLIRARSPKIRSKADASPVTDADEAAEAVILSALPVHCPGLPVIAEEEVAAGRAQTPGESFLLVDPLDGTREFVAGLDEFTVNIALIENGFPVAGAVYAPASAQLWWGASAHSASAAWSACVTDPGKSPAIAAENRIFTRPWPVAPVALASRHHLNTATQAWLVDRNIRDVRQAGSSLKFCLIAQGDADVYPRFGPINEWDIAAGDAVLRAAGGTCIRVEGGPVVYGNPTFSAPSFIAIGDPAGARTNLRAGM